MSDTFGVVAEGLDDALRRREFDQSSAREHADAKTEALRALGEKFQSMLDDFVERMSAARSPRVEPVTQYRKHRKLLGWHFYIVVPGRDRTAGAFVLTDGRGAHYDPVAKEVRYSTNPGADLANACYGREEPMMFTMGWDDKARRTAAALGDALVRLLGLSEAI
jgi:hypothetical protein